MNLVRPRGRPTLRTACVCALLTSGAPALVSAQVEPTENAPNAALPRLPDGRPDLQGLWLKSSGGFQGLFIGALNGTNFAAGGGRIGAGPPRGPQYEYTPEAEGERRDRQRDRKSVV